MIANNNIAIFLAARSGSKRLPNKHFLKINSKLKIIDLCILRLKKTKLVNKIFLCTTKKKEDDRFEKICKLHNIRIFRGSSNNVLKRLIDCAKENYIETVIRITADCPLIDPKLIDDCIKLFKKKNCDYLTNTLDLSFPDGQDIEIINLKTLKLSSKISKNKLNTEHVTSFIRKSKKFNKYNLKNLIDYSNRRWTLDYLDDYIFLKRVIKYFSPKIYFTWMDLIKAEKTNKSLVNIKIRK